MVAMGWGSLPEIDLSALIAQLAEDDADWQERALCAQTDPEIFFPEKGGSTRDGKRVCLACEVKDQCLQYALDREERFGIWGGLSERERRKLKRRALFENNPNPGRDIPDDEHSAILAMLATGATVNAVANHFGLTWKRVDTIRNRAAAA